MNQECDELVNLIISHLDEHKIPISNPNWEIRKSKISGRGIFAKRHIKSGEIIFVDYPLIIGPRACGDSICVICFTKSDLSECSKKCGLILCSFCQNCSKHDDECAKIRSWVCEETKITTNISKCLTPIRALFLDDKKKSLIKNLATHLHPQHGIEIDFLKNMGLKLENHEEQLLRLTCAAFDANAFQVLTDKDVAARGLYPLAAITNHNCVPNTGHVFDSDNYMIVRASCDIRKGDEIFNSYCRLLWSTMSRRYHLLITKHFSCQCQRCKDPTEFGTRLNAISCPECQGDMLPRNPLKSKTDWGCQNCSEVIPGSKAIFIMNTVSAGFLNIGMDDVQKILRFYYDKVARIMPECSQIVVEMKYRLVFLLGNEERYFYKDLSDDLLDLKHKFCKDLLEIIFKLGIGVRKIQGILLYEMVTCMREICERNNEINNNNDTKNFEGEINKLLEEISDISMFDVGAPKEIQELWKENGIKTKWRDYCC